jgi:hypothetical protein
LALVEGVDGAFFGELAFSGVAVLQGVQVAGSRRSERRSRRGPRREAGGVGIALRGTHGVEGVDGVGWRGEGPGRLPLGVAVAPIVGLQDDVTIAGEAVDVGAVPLGGAVLLRRDVAVA